MAGLMDGGIAGSGQVVGGPTMKYWAYDQNGNLIQTGGQGVGGLQQGQAGANYNKFFLGVGSQADAAVRDKMKGAIDPTTGHILKQPQTAAEFAEVERQAQEMASDQARSTFAQEAQMLGFSPNSGGTGINGFGGGGTGSGSMLPGGGAGGAYGNVPAPSVDKDILGGFKTNLLKTLDNPGIDARTEQDIINRGSEGLATAETGAKQGLVDAAAAAGFTPAGGSAQRGLASIASDYAGKKASNARDVGIDVANSRKQQMLQALGLAGNYTSHEQDAMNSYYRYLADSKREDRNMMIGLMNQQKPLVPSVTGGGYKNPAGGLSFAGNNSTMDTGNGPGAPVMGNGSASYDPFPDYHAAATAPKQSAPPVPQSPPMGSGPDAGMGGGGAVSPFGRPIPGSTQTPMARSMPKPPPPAAPYPGSSSSAGAPRSFSSSSSAMDPAMRKQRMIRAVVSPVMAA